MCLMIGSKNCDWFHYPYDDSPETANGIINRCQLYDYINFDGYVFNNEFGLIDLNINRAINKLELTVRLESLSHKQSVICLTETWLHYTSLPVVIPGHKTYNFSRTTGKGGDMFPCQSNIVCSVLKLTYVAFVSFQYAALSFTINERAQMHFGIYRPPSTFIIDFVVELSFLLTNLCNTTATDNLIIAG